MEVIPRRPSHSIPGVHHVWKQLVKVVHYYMLNGVIGESGILYTVYTFLGKQNNINRIKKIRTELLKQNAWCLNALNHMQPSAYD